MPRRLLLNHVSFFVMGLACAILPAQEPGPEGKPLPTTGDEVPQFASLDAWMQQFMQSRKIPGGSLAIAIDGESSWRAAMVMPIVRTRYRCSRIRCSG